MGNPPANNQKGFTLIELMIVVAIIAILSMVMAPKFVSFTQRAKVARFCSDFKQMVKAFDLYAVQNYDSSSNRGYPDDTNLTLPSGLEDYIDESVFLNPTPFGGRYNWDGPDFYTYAGLAAQDIDGGDTTMQLVEDKCDDGDLATGELQKTANGRYTWLLWVK